MSFYFSTTLTPTLSHQGRGSVFPGATTEDHVPCGGGQRWGGSIGRLETPHPDLPPHKGEGGT